jgi:hypothetical protein
LLEGDAFRVGALGNGGPVGAEGSIQTMMTVCKGDAFGVVAMGNGGSVREAEEGHSAYLYLYGDRYLVSCCGSNPPILAHNFKTLVAFVPHDRHLLGLC